MGLMSRAVCAGRNLTPALLTLLLEGMLRTMPQSSPKCPRVPLPCSQHSWAHLLRMTPFFTQSKDQRRHKACLPLGPHLAGKGDATGALFLSSPRAAWPKCGAVFTALGAFRCVGEGESLSSLRLRQGWEGTLRLAETKA